MDDMERALDCMKYGFPPDKVYQKLLSEGVERKDIVPVRLGDTVVGYYVVKDLDVTEKEITFKTDNIHFTESGDEVFQRFLNTMNVTPAFSMRRGDGK